jgi:transcriptional regulator with XRE-family HTH domain
MERGMTKAERQALANILRGQRIGAGLSASGLARQAGVDKATVTLLEQCKITHPRVETVRSLADVLGIPLADIYSAVNWLPEDTLPSLRPYMRAKYGALTEAELSEIERFINVVNGRNGGPRRGEDEVPSRMG